MGRPVGSRGGMDKGKVRPRGWGYPCFGWFSLFLCELGPNCFTIVGLVVGVYVVLVGARSGLCLFLVTLVSTVKNFLFNCS